MSFNSLSVMIHPDLPPAFRRDAIWLRVLAGITFPCSAVVLWAMVFASSVAEMFGTTLLLLLGLVAYRIRFWANRGINAGPRGLVLLGILILALAAAGLLVGWGVALTAEGPCDGGSCVLALVFGVGFAIAAFVLILVGGTMIELFLRLRRPTVSALSSDHKTARWFQLEPPLNGWKLILWVALIVCAFQLPLPQNDPWAELHPLMRWMLAGVAQYLVLRPLGIGPVWIVLTAVLGTGAHEMGRPLATEGLSVGDALGPLYLKLGWLLEPLTVSVGQTFLLRKPFPGRGRGLWVLGGFAAGVTPGIGFPGEWETCYGIFTALALVALNHSNPRPASAPAVA
jgi:hypothetical protein